MAQTPALAYGPSSGSSGWAWLLAGWWHSSRLPLLIAACSSASSTAAAPALGRPYPYRGDIGLIARANLDGTGVNRSLITGAGGPCCVAIQQP